MTDHIRSRTIYASIAGLALAIFAQTLAMPASAQNLNIQIDHFQGPAFAAPHSYDRYGHDRYGHGRYGDRVRGFPPFYRNTGHRRGGGLARSSTVFRITYENHAWVFQKSSCEIREDGRIMRVRFSNPPDRIEGFDQIGRLSAREVRRMVDLLPRAARREMTEPRREMADFGMISLTGFYRGRPVALKNWGDLVSVNPSRAAAQLISWAARVFPEGCPS